MNLFGNLPIIMLLNPAVPFSQKISYILSILFIVFAILPLHEYAHGLVAYKLGDRTAKYSGRLTINPLAHIDPFGSLAMLCVGIGWAKPVPIDSRNFKHPKSGMAITALAGPVSNLLAALFGVVLLMIFGLNNVSNITSDFLAIIAQIFILYIHFNLILAFFNLIPIPPLDGSKILFSFIPDRILYKYGQYQNYLTILLMVLLFTGFIDITFLVKPLESILIPQYIPYLY